MPKEQSGASERAEIESFVRSALGRPKPPPKPDPPPKPTSPAPPPGGASHFKETKP